MFTLPERSQDACAFGLPVHFHFARHSFAAWNAGITAPFPSFYGLLVSQVDADECPELTEREDVSSMPTLKIYKNGKCIQNLAGANVNTVSECLKKLIQANWFRSPLSNTWISLELRKFKAFEKGQMHKNSRPPVGKRKTKHLSTLLTRNSGSEWMLKSSDHLLWRSYCP